MNLDRIFNPQSIAIIGASNEVNSVGFGLIKNALEGNSQRKIFAVNPFRKKVLGLKCLPSVLSVKEDVDLAIIAVPAQVVETVIKECCKKRVGGIIVISAGFAEVGENGKALQEKIVDITKKAKIPLIGPNCLGIIRPLKELNASFAPLTPHSGGVAFISQSGALIDSVIDKASHENYGFSSLVSYGNEADVDICDFLLWFKDDEETKVIAIYLEGLKDGRRFMRVAKDVSEKKSIVILKAGKTEEGKKAVSTHTASLVGSHKIYSAAFAQSGVIEVDTMEDLLSVAKVLSENKKCKNGVGIITNGGGAGVLMTDYCAEIGINIPKLDKKHQIIGGFDDFFQDALNEFSNVKNYSTFTEYASDVNEPERRAEKDRLMLTHDYVVKIKIMREKSFSKHFLGSIVSSLSFTLFPIPYTNSYSVDLNILNSKGHLIKNYSRKTTLTKWVQTFLIFIYPFHPEKRKKEEIYVEFLHDIFRQIETEKVLKISKADN